MLLIKKLETDINGTNIQYLNNLLSSQDANAIKVYMFTETI